MDAEFLVALGQIIVINLVLAGDNAVVIALAARNLPDALQRRAIVLGTVAAIVMRVVLTAGVVTLLEIPYLKLVGGLLLLVIAYRLAVDDNESHGSIDAAEDLRNAVLTILMADLVMSLDNVLAVAAAANGDYLLITLGLLISIPIVMGGAALILAVIKRFPVIVWIGAALVAYTGLELMLDEAVVSGYQQWEALGGVVHRLTALAITLLVLAVAFFRKNSTKRNSLLRVEGSVADE